MENAHLSQLITLLGLNCVKNVTKVPDHFSAMQNQTYTDVYSSKVLDLNLNFAVTVSNAYNHYNSTMLLRFNETVLNHMSNQGNC